LREGTSTRHIATVVPLYVVKLVALCFQKKMVALVWGGALLYVKGKKKWARGMEEEA